MLAVGVESGDLGSEDPSVLGIYPRDYLAPTRPAAAADY